MTSIYGGSQAEGLCHVCTTLTHPPSLPCPPGGSVQRVVVSLRERIHPATHRLANLEAFKLGMVEVERLVLAGVPMGKTE
jgi:hypothetical protein